VADESSENRPGNVDQVIRLAYEQVERLVSRPIGRDCVAMGYSPYDGDY
jgi:hypothetical protein